jgi:hypothetical protein
MISSLLSLLNNFFIFIFKASIVATTTSRPVSFDQDKLQEEGRSCSTTVDHLLLLTNSL